jgi:hypothetical protein
MVYEQSYLSLVSSILNDVADSPAQRRYLGSHIPAMDEYFSAHGMFVYERENGDSYAGSSAMLRVAMESLLDRFSSDKH